MKSQRKINYRLYLPGLLITLIGGGFFWYTLKASLLWFFLLILAVLLNHYLLFNGMKALMGSIAKNEEFNPLKLMGYLLGKTMILAAAFYMILKFVPSTIYLALIVYIFQLIILLISIKKETQVI